MKFSRKINIYFLLQIIDQRKKVLKQTSSKPKKKKTLDFLDILLETKVNAYDFQYHAQLVNPRGRWLKTTTEFLNDTGATLSFMSHHDWTNAETTQKVVLFNHLCASGLKSTSAED